MLLNNRINHGTGIYPRLSRVWIKTGDPRMPLRSVWIDESRLHRIASEADTVNHASETTEFAEDHLCLAA